jgi:hypothetical protein
LITSRSVSDRALGHAAVSRRDYVQTDRSNAATTGRRGDATYCGHRRAVGYCSQWDGPIYVGDVDWARNLDGWRGRLIRRSRKARSRVARSCVTASTAVAACTRTCVAGVACSACIAGVVGGSTPTRATSDSSDTRLNERLCVLRIATASRNQRQSTTKKDRSVHGGLVKVGAGVVGHPDTSSG